MMNQPQAWWSSEWYRWEDQTNSRSLQVDDVHLRQPIGFVWFSKPRYRVKAGSRKMENAV